MDDFERTRLLIDKAEKESDINVKQNLLISAIDDLDEILEEENERKNVDKIIKQKKAIARSLILQLPQMNLRSFQAFELFVLVLSVRLGRQVEALISEDKQIEQKYAWIKDQFSEELAGLMKLLRK